MFTVYNPFNEFTPGVSSQEIISRTFEHYNQYPPFFRTSQISFSHVTPLRAKRNVLLFTLLVCFLINYHRCGQEISIEPSSSDVYSSMLGTMDTFSHTWIPFTIGRSSRALPSTYANQELNGKEACMAVHCGVQLAFGFVLPLAVLGAEEIFSRKAFGARRGLKFSQDLPFLSLLQQLAIAVLQAAVGFQVVAVAVPILLAVLP